MKLIEWFLVWCDARRARLRRRAWGPARALGREGEDLAHRYLQQRGYYVVARNYRISGGGELDLVASQGGLLVFVEVKSRSSEAYGAPERNIDRGKQWRMIGAARHYLRRSGHDPGHTRFDTIGVIFNGPEPEIHHEEGVFFLPDAI